jgi:hypothetical protein
LNAPFPVGVLSFLPHQGSISVLVPAPTYAQKKKGVTYDEIVLGTKPKPPKEAKRKEDRPEDSLLNPKFVVKSSPILWHIF